MITRAASVASLLIIIVFAVTGLAQQAGTWQAGVAKVNVTPPKFMPMSGYASRGAKHADEKLTDLWAKALVLQDAEGRRALLLSFDLIGLDRGLSQSICEALLQRYNLQRDEIALCASHTHTGPVVAKNLRPMHYMLLDDADRQLVDDYAKFVQQQMVAVVGEAIENLATADVSWGNGTATFAVNRRNNRAADVPSLRQQGKLRGPYDHDVPVLAVRDGDGTLRAVVFGYACHCTVLSSFQWSGDYAGFAQIEVEQAHPDCVALFWAGCGGDQNPLPRREVELAREYGRQLGSAVASVIRGEMRPLAPQLRTTYQEIDLALAELPTREELDRDTQSSNKYVAARAKHLLRQLDTGQPISQTYPYPVEVWRLGNEVLFTFLGGEVTVGYPLRLKHELGDDDLDRKNVWVAGYANDVMAYIPSLRVLNEGGYEGASAMVYYGLPTTWTADVEEDVVAEVRRQVTGN